MNETRIKVWKQQPDAFVDEAVIDADGTFVETTGERKKGIDISKFSPAALVVYVGLIAPVPLGTDRLP